MIVPGVLMIALAVFVVVCAMVCFRRAADPMGLLRRIEQRYGVNYAALVTDPQKYVERQAALSRFSGVFLMVVALVLVAMSVMLIRG